MVVNNPRFVPRANSYRTIRPGFIGRYEILRALRMAIKLVVKRVMNGYIASVFRRH